MGPHDQPAPVATCRRSIPGRLTVLVAGLALATTACLAPAPGSGLRPAPPG